MTDSPKRLLAVLMACGTLGACGSDDTSTETDRWSGNLDGLTVQWSAAPGIELEGGVSVPVRAYFESRLLAQYKGTLDAAYPGFTEAVPPNEPDDSPTISARDRRPPLNVPVTSPVVGTNRFLIQSAAEQNGRYTVTVCNFLYAAAERQPGGAYRTLTRGGAPATRGIVAMQLQLTAPSEASSSALPPQSGPSPEPGQNVFGDWRITGFLAATTDYVRPEWDDYSEAAKRCVDEAPDPLERRAFLTSGEHPREDFPSLPPEPGWPDALSQ
ncbi:hypothetical protein [Mycobacterium sp. GA-2829]|uniref:hypothetical protein n=1 Tax=Mycobacterium sp. GA-2829 TaxID=1772283 RepID=UPI000AADC062|nr:hypothetical protein [Mycobacterium sp. GA-2829]